MPPWMYFVGWVLTCVGFVLSFSLVLRKERKDAAQAKAAAEAAVLSGLKTSLAALELESALAESERHAQTGVLEKMSGLHERVIEVMAHHSTTQRDIQNLQSEVRDIRRDLSHLRVTPAPTPSQLAHG